MRQTGFARSDSGSTMLNGNAIRINTLMHLHCELGMPQDVKLATP